MEVVAGLTQFKGYRTRIDAMSERTDIHTALGFVLRRMNELAEEAGKRTEEACKEAEALGNKWTELMDRLHRLPLFGEQVERKQS
jgi:hypothetical protein